MVMECYIGNITLNESYSCWSCTKEGLDWRSGWLRWSNAWVKVEFWLGSIAVNLRSKHWTQCILIHLEVLSTVRWWMMTERYIGTTSLVLSQYTNIMWILLRTKCFSRRNGHMGKGYYRIDTQAFRKIYDSAVLNSNGTLHWDHCADSFMEYDPAVNLEPKRAYYLQWCSSVPYFRKAWL